MFFVPFGRMVLFARNSEWPAITYIWMGRPAYAAHCMWRVAQNVQTSFLVVQKKFASTFHTLHTASLTTLKFKTTLVLFPTLRNSASPKSASAHILFSHARSQRPVEKRSERQLRQATDQLRSKDWVSPRKILKSSVLKVLPPKISSLFVEGGKRNLPQSLPLLKQIPFQPWPSRTKGLAKEALTMIKKLQSAQANRGKSVVVGFTGELHRFSCGQVIFSLASGPIRSKHRCSRSTSAHQHSNNEASTDQPADRCMQHWLSESTVAADHPE